MIGNIYNTNLLDIRTLYIEDVEYKNLKFTAILYSGVHKRQYLFRIFVCNHILLSMLINNTHQSITWEKKDEGFLRMWNGSLYFFYENVRKHKHTYRGIFTWNHRPQGDIYTMKKKKRLCIQIIFFAEECTDFYVLFVLLQWQNICVFDINFKDLWIPWNAVFVILLLDYMLSYTALYKVFFGFFFVIIFRMCSFKALLQNQELKIFGTTMRLKDFSQTWYYISHWF